MVWKYIIFLKRSLLKAWIFFGCGLLCSQAVGEVRLRILLLAVVSTIAISAIGWEAISVKATISAPGISLSLGLSISRPLAIVTTIAISAIGWEAVSIEATISVPGISLSLWLSISSPC